jgi:hypothetical protein
MEIDPEAREELDTTEDLDLVTVFSSDKHTSQMEAQFIRGILEAGGVPAVIVDQTALPNLPADVRVPRARLEEALILIAESEAAGPRGAEEAEQGTEGSGQSPDV